MNQSPSGIWLPDLFGKQFNVYDSYARMLLVCGPRLSAKSWAILHKVVRHMWETPNARVGMFTKILKNSKDAGAWKNLHDHTLKEWISAKIGMRYTTIGYDGIPGPKIDGQTRTPYFKLRNMWGGESTCMLFSLDNDNEAEAKLKEREFSMLYFSELSNFMDKKVLSIGVLSLRMPHLRFDQQQWIADTNPGEEGESSWIFKTWYLMKRQTYEEYCTYQRSLGLPIMKEAVFTNFVKGLELIEMSPKDNIHLKPGQLEELEATYSYDPGLYARYVEGKWTYGDGDASRHFRSFFKPAVHVVGNIEGPDESTWQYLNPSAQCFELITGWDLGETNHSAHIIEKLMLDVLVPGKPSIKRGFFHVLDEQVTIKQEISIEQFTEEFMLLVAGLETATGRTYSLDRAWSDKSSIEKYSSTADTFPYLQVHAASNGRIFLQGVPKAKGSVRVRVQLLKMLLAQGRIKVSAHCVATIRMLEDLKKGKAAVDYVVQDENKHAFDSLTYPLLMECSEELQQISNDSVGTRKSEGMIVMLK